MRIKILINYVTTNHIETTYINTRDINHFTQKKKFNIEAYGIDFFLKLCYKNSVK